MPKKKNFELSPLEAMHQTIKDLYNARVVDAQILRKFDALCLPEVKDLSANAIKKIRIPEKASQGVFVKYLNISVSTVKQWELGDKHPRGTSLKLLNLVEQKGLEILT